MVKMESGWYRDVILSRWAGMAKRESGWYREVILVGGWGW